MSRTKQTARRSTGGGVPRKRVKKPKRNTKNPEERDFLICCHDLINEGELRQNRTGTPTYTKFGNMMRFSLTNGRIPLLTSKRMFWRGIVEETLWFLRGDTNVKHLQERDVKIWDKWASREFLDSRGLTQNEEGDVGPMYGFQWRHFGAEYKGCNEDYTGKGVDQLARVIHTLKENPRDRRMVISAWNPADLDRMALPPCHYAFQFDVDNDGGLRCMLVQRSCDMGLGVPFNIASYALITHIIAKLCGLTARELVVSQGNYHVYENHVKPLETVLSRDLRNFPVVKISDRVQDLDDIRSEDILLEDYHPHDAVQMLPSV